MKDQHKRWFWLADYCKKKGIPPHQSWAWNEAEKAYDEAYPKVQIEYIQFENGDWCGHTEDGGGVNCVGDSKEVVRGFLEAAVAGNNAILNKKDQK